VCNPGGKGLLCGRMSWDQSWPVCEWFSGRVWVICGVVGIALDWVLRSMAAGLAPYALFGLW
jgi:hypothetical protein